MTLPKYNATIIERRELHPGLCFLWIKPDDGPFKPFLPGQYVTIGRIISEELVTRTYSIGSSANRLEALELFIVLVDDGEFTSRLLGEPEGGRLWLDQQAYGELTLDDVNDQKDLVLVSTGTGVAPYLSMYRTYRAQPRWRRIVLINGVRHAADLGYRRELETVAGTDDAFTYLPIVTRDAQAVWSGLRGRVQSILVEERFRGLTGFDLSPDECHVFLCGNPDMVDSVEADLTGRGFTIHGPERSGTLHLEKYW
jgi:ferredoxin--NADP+ reductase